MTSGKKISKKKLKEPDEFITFTEQAFLFIRTHQKRITAGGMIVLIMLLSFVLFQMWEKRKEGAAYRKLRLALETYQTVSSSYKEGSPSEFKNGLEKFDEVIKGFPNTSSGKLAFIYKGNIYLRLGQFEEAAKAYQAFLERGGKERLYRLFAMEGLGYACEGKKDYEKAIDAYKNVISIGEGFQSGEAYFNMGLCYEKLGKNKEALENYKAFLKVAPKSQMANAALRKISLLEK